ncbi:MAG TPA: hypothetical protein VF719_10215, partial [Abditibacteriaceae bacterium]
MPLASAFSRRSFFAIFLTTVVVLFLWLPPLFLYGSALSGFASHAPSRLLGALPHDSLSRFLFFNTVELGLLTALFALCLGVPVGIVGACGGRTVRQVSVVLCALPLALPPMQMATAWLELSRTPPARSMASLAAPIASAYPPILVTAMVLALCFYPIPALATRAALLATPRGIEDAAALFGNRWLAFWYVWRPLLAPALLGAAGIVAALAMWEMGAPDLLDARTYSVQIYRDLNAADSLNAGGKATAAALSSLPMLVLGILFLWPAARALRFYDELGASDEAASTVFQRKYAVGLAAKARRFLLVAFATLVFIASPILPLVIFVSQLGSLRIFIDVWEANSGELQNSVVLSSIAAVAITAVALMLVTAWRTLSRVWRTRALLLCFAPFLLAPVMTGIALIEWYNRPAFSLIYGGLAPTGNPTLDFFSDAFARYAIVLIGYAARFLPLAVFLLYQARARISPAPIEAAQNLGASDARATRG